MPRLKITYVLPNLEPGGTEKHVLSLCRSLDRSRFSVSLVTTAGGGALYDRFSEILPVAVTGDPGYGKRHRTEPVDQLRTVFRLAGRFRREKPDILHAYLPAANVIGPIAARMAGVKRIIVSKRSMADYKVKFPFLRKVEPIGNLMADVILVNSDAVRVDVERTESFWEGKFRKIYNGVSPIPAWTPELAAEFRIREGIPSRAIAALTVSNFYPYKGHDYLVEAVPRVVAACPEVLFLLVGRDSGTKERTRERVRQLGLERHIRFLGSRADVPDLVRASDLLVHPSLEEGFSNAILEAMAGGLPVVACEAGGNPELVGDGVTGILVPPRAPESLAAAILSLLNDGEKRKKMGAEGRRRASEEFPLEGMIKEMEALYDSLAEGNP
jgi:glycosyltransferase involved in cell wall biosynthesis